MKAWAMKSACIACSKSTRLKAYFGTFSHWVPCTIQHRLKQRGTLDRGMVFVEFHAHMHWDKFRLQLPIDTIKVEHKLFRHWVPLRALDELLTVLRKHEQESQAWYWTEEWQEGERQADADIAAGRVKSFATVAELIADLNAPDEQKS